ncbi:MAG: sigma 54-interacting transcriptional regulator [Thermodesulfobacteriota bacterium]
MVFSSLKGKLLFAASALVICSGLLISALVTQRYSAALREATVAQLENAAHALALDAADRVLINDLVGLQKLLEQWESSHPGLGYLFVVKDGSVLAHTFSAGVPAGLVGANTVTPEMQPGLREIVSTEGERFLDIAWPIFQGRAGVLRAGYSESHFQEQVRALWTGIGVLTLGILVIGVIGSLVFVRRITLPLAALVQATKEIVAGRPHVRVVVASRDELSELASSFNYMVARMEDYTSKLEEQTLELDRAHQQTRAFCGIVQEVGALKRLEEIGFLLIGKFREILLCRHLMLVVLDLGRRRVHFLTEKKSTSIEDQQTADWAASIIDDLEKPRFTKDTFQPPLMAEQLKAAGRRALIPLKHKGQACGVLIIACPGSCQCNFQEVEGVSLILSQAAGSILRAVQYEEDLLDLTARLGMTTEFCGLIGKDPQMRVVYKLIEDIAPSDATVLIQGESGTGKELVARALHQMSLRKEARFVVINCSAYPGALLESELFGHEKGAFTGAVKQRPGRFEQAHGGTVFLDEIGEISLSAQIKLLRVLQTQSFERLGGEKTLNVDVRVIAATNKNLLEEVKAGRFREDLFYRLNVIPIFLPPLRARLNDIPLLAGHFLKRFAFEQGKEITEIRSEAMQLLMDYPWPGNVRELENSLEHAVVLAKTSRLEPADLPTALRTTAAPVQSHSTLEENEVRLLRQILEEAGWNKKLAAERLGIGRSTLYSKMKRFNIQKPTTH